MIIKHLSKSYPNKPLFKDLSLQIDAGLLLISAPSGTGKTTLLNIIIGIIEPDEGEVILNHEFAYAGQNTSLLYNFSLEDNLKLLNINYHEDELIKYLNAFSFKDFFKVKLVKLSGGERTKAEIITCLLKNAYNIILDEPFSSLDSESKQVLIKIIDNLKVDHLVILVNHEINLDINPDMALYLDKNNIIINNERKIGSIKEEIVNKGKLKNLYSKAKPKKVFKIAYTLFIIALIFFSFATAFYPFYSNSYRISKTLQYNVFDVYNIGLTREVNPIKKEFFKDQASKCYYSVELTGKNSKNSLYSFLFIENEFVKEGNVYIDAQNDFSINSDILQIGDVNYFI